MCPDSLLKLLLLTKGLEWVKCSMSWVLCAFAKVWQCLHLGHWIDTTFFPYPPNWTKLNLTFIWTKTKAFRAIAPSSVVFQDSTLNWHWRWLFHNIFSQILFCIQIVTIFFSRICSPLTFIKVHMFQIMDTLKYALVLGKKC